jgi:predicted ATPase/DNA-binding winged helix-turn-helix (wHTH) protein
MARGTSDQICYRFGAFELDPRTAALLENGRAVRLGARAMAILTVLVERAGETVPQDQIIERVWPDTIVDDANLRVHLVAIRKALREGRDEGGRYILNVPGHGYRFVAAVDKRSVAAAPAPGPSPLPALLTSLVGRDHDIAAIGDALARHRLVSVVGPGGMGKTSVALATAHARAASYEHGAWFVDLTAVGDPALVPAAIAAALRVPTLSTIAQCAVATHLADQRLLIVFDNCEHVIDAAAEHVETLLRAAPGMHALVTSREPLRAEGESIYRLPPLAAPADAAVVTSAQALTYPAVRLFVDRARAAIEAFELADADATTVAQLCSTLGGVPLAIELAAARVDVIAMGATSAKLGDLLSLLTRGRRTANPRHQTLRATLDWSFDLLPGRERTVFARLGVFRSRFSLDAALAVIVDDAIAPGELGEALASLVAKSLVVATFERGAGVYRLLETTRAYALDQLDAGDDARATRVRHAAYLRATWTALALTRGPTDTSQLELHVHQIDDVRAALDWALSGDGDAHLALALAAASAPLWFHLSLVDEYASRAERALAADGAARETDAELKVLVALGSALYNTHGSVPGVLAACTRALAVAARLDHPDGTRWALFGTWQYHLNRGDYARALEIVEDFERFAAGVGDPAFLGPRMAMIVRSARGERTIARGLADEILRRYPTRTTRGYAGLEYDPRVSALAILARICWLEGFPAEAARLARASLDEALALDHALSICFAAALGACPVALWLGDLDTAAEALAVLVEHSIASRLQQWHRYGQVYAYAIDARRGLPTRIDPITRGAWSHRHREELAVLVDEVDPALVERARCGEPTWCAPEIVRRAALRVLGDDDAAGRALLATALELARAQGAPAWELRVATSLAAVARTRADRRDAIARLEALLARYPEATATADHAAARAQLTTLDIA